jgi:hypothetical protein
MGLAGAAVNKSPNKPDQSYRNRSAYLVGLNPDSARATRSSSVIPASARHSLPLRRLREQHPRRTNFRGCGVGALTSRRRSRFRLFDPDHHRVRAYQVLDVALAEARVGHPGAAVCTRVVEPDWPLNQHVETH